MTASHTAVEDIVITRTYDAPRSLVFRAWTDPQWVMKWWGPEHFTSPSAVIDLRVGGKYVFCMRAPDGTDLYSCGIFQEIDPPSRLVMTDSFSDAGGNVVSPTAYGMSPDIPDEFLVTVTFEENDGKTTMSVRHSGMPASEMREMTSLGWSTQLDKLGAALKAA